MFRAVKQQTRFCTIREKVLKINSQCNQYYFWIKQKYGMDEYKFNYQLLWGRVSQQKTTVNIKKVDDFSVFCLFAVFAKYLRESVAEANRARWIHERLERCEAVGKRSVICICRRQFFHRPDALRRSTLPLN